LQATAGDIKAMRFIVEAVEDEPESLLSILFWGAVKIGLLVFVGLPLAIALFGH
jgi:hypothetical protein